MKEEELVVLIKSSLSKKNGNKSIERKIDRDLRECIHGKQQE